MCINRRHTFTGRKRRHITGLIAGNKPKQQTSGSVSLCAAAAAISCCFSSCVDAISLAAAAAAAAAMLLF